MALVLLIVLLGSLLGFTLFFEDMNAGTSIKNIKFKIRKRGEEA